MTTSSPSNNQLNPEKTIDPFDEFVYVVSHDLKEPLRGILTYITFIMEDHPELIEGKLKDRLTKIDQLSTKMSRMLEGLTQYSRIGRINEPPVAVDANVVIQTIANQLKDEYAQAPKIIEISTPLPTLVAQPKHLYLLFKHLIENGIKFNNLPLDQRRVWIDFQENKREIVFSIRDNGIGIPARYQERIFKIFKSKLHRDKYGEGIGHGLAVSTKLLTLYNSKIWVKSEEHAGTTIYFSWPTELIRRSK